MVLDQLPVTYSRLAFKPSGIAIAIQIYLQVLRVLFCGPSSYCGGPGLVFTGLQSILLVVTRLGVWLGRSIESLCEPIKLFAGSVIAWPLE